MNAQTFVGYASDNYNGLHGTLSNPANAADSRTKLDINVVSGGGSLYTAYTNLTLGNITALAEDNAFDGLERGATMGIGFRLGLLVIGSNSLFSNLISKNARVANFFMGIKIPFYHKRNRLMTLSNVSPCTKIEKSTIT